jgi:hypothetical protein
MEKNRPGRAYDAILGCGANILQAGYFSHRSVPSIKKTFSFGQSRLFLIRPIRRLNLSSTEQATRAESNRMDGVPKIGQAHPMADIARTGVRLPIIQSGSHFQTLLVAPSLGTAIALFGFAGDVTKKQEVASWKTFAKAASLSTPMPH